MCFHLLHTSLYAQNDVAVLPAAWATLLYGALTCPHRHLALFLAALHASILHSVIKNACSYVHAAEPTSH